MFDSYHTHPQTSVSVNKTVHEHRAPTDESVRLLRELEQAAQNKILDSVRVTDSLFDGLLHYQHDYVNLKKLFACVIKVNGKKITARFDCDESLDREQIIFGIRDAIAREIANQITASVLSSSNNLRF